MRLLVIEDDPDLNRQLATALTDAGYVVDRAFDGEEGHYLGESEPYDAVILDISFGGDALRQAAAEARHILLEQAADRLDATPDELMIQDGVISVRQDRQRSVSYSELMGGKRFETTVSYTARLKAPADYHVVGKSIQRVDIPAKFTGQQSFIQDLVVPGMLHARLVRPPSSAAQMVSVDENSIKHVPGIVQIVQRGNFIGDCRRA